MSLWALFRLVCLAAAAHPASAASSSPTVHATMANRAHVRSKLKEPFAPRSVRNAAAAPPLSVKSGAMTDRSCAAVASLSMTSCARIAVYMSALFAAGVPSPDNLDDAGKGDSGGFANDPGSPDEPAAATP